MSTSDEHDSRYRCHLCSHQLTTSNASLGREKVGDPGRKSWEPREKKLRAEDDDSEDVHWATFAPPEDDECDEGEDERCSAIILVI